MEKRIGAGGRSFFVSHKRLALNAVVLEQLFQFLRACLAKHDPDALRLEFQIDQEQQHQHFKFGDIADLADIGHEPKCEGTDRDTATR